MVVVALAVAAAVDTVVVTVVVVVVVVVFEMLDLVRNVAAMVRLANKLVEVTDEAEA